MNRVLTKAAKVAVAVSGPGPEMIAQLEKVLTAQATLTPAAFQEKVRQLPILARATLVAVIEMICENDPPDRAQLERLRKALE